MQRPHCYCHGNRGFAIGKGNEVCVQPRGSVWWTNMRMLQRFNTASSPHSSTHGRWGGFHKNQEILRCDALCCGSIACSTGTRLPLSGPNMPFCASHFNLWGLGKDNSGRIILPPFFQLWGNLVFWQLSAFASQTWLTLVLTRPLSLHLQSTFP